MKHLNEDGFGAAEVVITLLGVVIICATGWYVWRSKESAYRSLNSAQTVSTQKVAATPAVSPVGYLSIHELGIKIPLTPSIKDAYYVKTTVGSATYYTLSTHSLDAYEACRATTDSGGVAAVGHFTDGQTDPLIGDYAKEFPKAPTIEGRRYYIKIVKATNECTNGRASYLYGKILASFDAAYAGITATQ